MDPALGVALVSSGSVAVVAVAGSLAQVFGPAWVASRANRAQVEAARQDARYARALELIELLSKPTFGVLGDETSRWFAECQVARARFAATLRAGERGVEVYLWRAIEVCDERTGAREELARVVSLISDHLFSYLRGEISADELLRSGY